MDVSTELSSNRDGWLLVLLRARWRVQFLYMEEGSRWKYYSQESFLRLPSIMDHFCDLSVTPSCRIYIDKKPSINTCLRNCASYPETYKLYIRIVYNSCTILNMHSPCMICAYTIRKYIFWKCYKFSEYSLSEKLRTKNTFTQSIHLDISPPTPSKLAALTNFPGLPRIQLQAKERKRER